jgi:histidine triad (HIT) family protein
MSDCIFCKIIKGEVDSNFLYEDDFCVVFRDINPKQKTHLLVVSRKHIPSIAEMSFEDEKIVSNMIIVAKKMAEKLGLKGYRLQFNVGKDGGQEIFHIHLHLLSKF